MLLAILGSAGQAEPETCRQQTERQGGITASLPPSQPVIRCGIDSAQRRM